jgi:hypothetical protein
VDKARVIEEIEIYLQQTLKEATSEPDADEIRRLLTIYRFLPRRHYEADDRIIPSALVELKLSATRAFYFVAPQGGGLVTRVDGQPVQVITPQSPLGEALLGKKKGDRISVEIRGGTREYEVLSVT